MLVLNVDTSEGREGVGTICGHCALTGHGTLGVMQLSLRLVKM